MLESKGISLGSSMFENVINVRSPYGNFNTPRPTKRVFITENTIEVGVIFG
jgi:hypothetical protein